MFGWRLAGKWLEGDGNAAGKVRVIGGNRGHNGGWCWSQMEELDKGRCRSGQPCQWMLTGVEKWSKKRQQLWKPDK